MVSADGKLNAFDAVKRLVAAAPAFDKWVVVAFRQPNPRYTRIVLGDRAFDVEGAYFRYGRDGAKLGIQLLLPGYTDDDDGWKGAAFLLLDGLLGEYGTEMFIGFVEMKPVPAELPPGSLPLSELPAVVEAFRQPSSN